MRCFFGLMCVLALALVASPLSVSAQAGEEDSLSSWQVDYETTPTSTSQEYNLEKKRVQRAGIGLGISAAVFTTGAVLLGVSLSGDCMFSATAEQRQKCDRRAYAGAALAAGGVIGMLTSGILLGKRKRERDREEQAQYSTRRRAQWDLVQSRLVF